MNRNNVSHMPHDDRRAHRKSVDCEAPVTNVMTGDVMGRIGNISSTGMLLICPREPRSNALYQCMIPLAVDGATQHIEVGVQEQWHQPSDSAGQFWAGFRIIAIGDEDNVRLRDWLNLPE